MITSKYLLQNVENYGNNKNTIYKAYNILNSYSQESLFTINDNNKQKFPISYAASGKRPWYFVADKNVLTIKIHDKGTGYDASQVKEPKIKEKIKSDYKRGWGLHLIKELMDTVEFEATGDGTTVTMTKKK